MSFLEKVASSQHSKPMSEDATKLMTQVLMAEMSNADTPAPDSIPENERPFLMNVALKRIEGLKLPISFSLEGILAAEALTEGRVGAMVMILVDALTKHEGETITAKMIADMYPFGFYNEETAIDYIDNYLKPRKVKWAEIY